MADETKVGIKESIQVDAKVGEPKQPDVKPEEKKEIVKEQKFVKEEEQAKDLDISAFDNILEGNRVPKIPEQKQLETKPEDKKDEQPKEKQEKEVLDKTKIEEEKAKRDYSGIDETLLPQVKKMGNEFYEAFTPILREHKKLKEEAAVKEQEIAKLKENKIPEDYFQHPKGFVLTPEYEAGVNTLIRANQIVSHWEQQLEKVKSGDDTYQEITINRQTGEFELSRPIKAEKGDEKLIQSWIDGAKSQALEIRSYAEGVAKSHNENYKKAIDAVKDFEKKSFVQFEGEKAKELEPIVNDTIAKALPSVFHRNPLAPSLAKAILTIHMLGKRMKEIEGSKKVEEEKKKEAEKIQPTKREIESGENGERKSDITMEDFENVIAGRRGI